MGNTAVSKKFFVYRYPFAVLIGYMVRDFLKRYPSNEKNVRWFLRQYLKSRDFLSVVKRKESYSLCANDTPRRTEIG